jgi:hypothetical protein
MRRVSLVKALMEDVVENYIQIQEEEQIRPGSAALE